MAEVRVEGLAELKAALQDLPVKIELNVMRGALRAGGNVIAEEARRLCPEAPPSAPGVKVGARIGELKRSIRVSMRVRSKAGWVNAQVKAGNFKAWYAHLVEFGTAAHWIRSKFGQVMFINGKFVRAVHHPGARKDKPFLRPAFDSKARESIEAMADYIRKRLPKEIAKQGRVG